MVGRILFQSSLYLIAILAVLILILLLLYIILAITSLTIQSARTRKVPAGLPWVGIKGKRWLPRIRATLGEFSGGKTRMQEGCDKYSKHNQPFILPNRLWPEVILPPSSAHWIASQPENVLSFGRELDDTLALDYLGHGPDKAYMLDHAVIRRDITRSLLKLTPQVLTEITASVEENLAHVESDWTAVPLIQHLESITHRATAVFIVGAPLCRDPGYFAATSRWMTAVGVAALLNRCYVPVPLRPLWGRVFWLSVLPFKWLAIRSILPVVQGRLRSAELSLQSAKADTETPKPDDVLQWVIHDLISKRPLPSLSAWDICGKAIMTEFLALHTTNQTLSRVLLDILIHPNAPSLLPQLREEASTALSALPHDPTALRHRMPKLDSVIRETTRYHPMFAHTLQREVIAPSGITTPEGLYLPQGLHIATFEPGLFDSSILYDPLRSYKQGAGEGSDDEIQRKQKSAVDISDGSLAFGQGRHACPGRFFAVHVIKLILGYLLMQYDLEPLTEEPKFISMGETDIPSPKILLKMRRRRQDVTESLDSNEDDGTGLEGRAKVA